MVAAAILTNPARGGKARLSAPTGTRRLAAPFGGEEVAMLKALLTPVVLGLTAALVIRLAMQPRRTY